VLPVLLVDATEVVETEGSQLQKFLLGADSVADCFVEEHIDALGHEVDLLPKLQSSPSHNLQADLIDEVR
jgi:hypothetical protein